MTTAMNDHLPSLGWSPTNPRMVNNQKEVYYKLGIWHLDLTHKKKAIQLPWMVTYHPKDVHPQPKDGHPPEESVVQTWNLAIRFNSQNESQVSTWMVTYHPYDGHPPTQGWSPDRRKCTTDMEFGT